MITKMNFQIKSGITQIDQYSPTKLRFKSQRIAPGVNIEIQ